jgi:hypothetical protein
LWGGILARIGGRFAMEGGLVILAALMGVEIFGAGVIVW